MEIGEIGPTKSKPYTPIAKNINTVDYVSEMNPVSNLVQIRQWVFSASTWQFSLFICLFIYMSIVWRP